MGGVNGALAALASGVVGAPAAVELTVTGRAVARRGPAEGRCGGPEVGPLRSFPVDAPARFPADVFAPGVFALELDTTCEVVAERAVTVAVVTCMVVTRAAVAVVVVTPGAVAVAVVVRGRVTLVVVRVVCVVCVVVRRGAVTVGVVSVGVVSVGVVTVDVVSLGIVTVAVVSFTVVVGTGKVGITPAAAAAAASPAATRQINPQATRTPIQRAGPEPVSVTPAFPSRSFMRVEQDYNEVLGVTRDGEPVEFELEWYEAERGAVRPVEFAETLACADCRGSGLKAGVTPAECVACRGRGRHSRVTESTTVRLLELIACTQCGGRGRDLAPRCTTCGGTGVTSSPRVFSLRIPPGVGDGDLIQVDGVDQRFRLNVGPRPRVSRAVIAVAVAALVCAVALLLYLTSIR
jgi:hypothetical protein